METKYNIKMLRRLADVHRPENKLELNSRIGSLSVDVALRRLQCIRHAVS